MLQNVHEWTSSQPYLLPPDPHMESVRTNDMRLPLGPACKADVQPWAGGASSSSQCAGSLTSARLTMNCLASVSEIKQLPLSSLIINWAPEARKFVQYLWFILPAHSSLWNSEILHPQRRGYTHSHTHTRYGFLKFCDSVCSARYLSNFGSQLQSDQAMGLCFMAFQCAEISFCSSPAGFKWLSSSYCCLDLCWSQVVPSTQSVRMSTASVYWLYVTSCRSDNHRVDIRSHSRWNTDASEGSGFICCEGILEIDMVPKCVNRKVSEKDLALITKNINVSVEGFMFTFMKRILFCVKTF